jgi:mono/diheme cytochrome c family protein
MFLSLVAAVAASISPFVAADEVKTDLYTVVEGNKVDADTLQGFKVWRQANCAACHGANQEGLAGPSLVNSLKVLTKEEFVTTVTNGRIERGMPPHIGNPLVMENLNKIYSYLKGRSNGDIKTARVSAIE